MNDHLKRELYNLGQFAHHGACNAALVYIAKLEQALAEASKNAALFKELLLRARIYRDNYLLDEIDDTELCLAHMQHKDLLAFSAAIDQAIKENQHE